MTFREITFGSTEYQAEWELREAVLRRPLGLSLAAKNLEVERDQWHFGLFDQHGKLRASVIAVPLDTAKVRLRQMAVDPDFTGRGIGAKILAGLESHLRRQGCREISLHARSEVRGFYEKSGYAVNGPEFVEVGIPHFPMVKFL